MLAIVQRVAYTKIKYELYDCDNERNKLDCDYRTLREAVHREAAHKIDLRGNYLHLQSEYYKVENQLKEATKLLEEFKDVRICELLSKIKKDRQQ